MDLRIDVTPDMDRFAGKYQRAGQVIQREMRTLMTQSVAILDRQAKANAPVRTGTLRRSITGQVSGGGATVVGRVGTSLKYAPYVHEGTAPHVIVPVSRKALYWPGAAHPVRRVNHPGTRPNPFLRKALAQRRGDVLRLWHTLAQRVMAGLG
jgi:HK97 gp10 family phage protein